MPYNFFLQLLMMLSLGIIVYILASAVPRIEDELEAPRREGTLDKVVKKIPLDRIDNFFNLFLQKIFRRIKIFLMKMDNIVNKRLNRFKSENGKNKEKDKPDLFSLE